MVEVELIRDVPVPMRDGTILRADIHQPGNAKDPATARWEDFQMTTQMLYHGEKFPSRVTLPILPDGHLPSPELSPS